MSQHSSCYLSADEQSDQWSETSSESYLSSEESLEDEFILWMYLYDLLDEACVTCNCMECICSSASSLQSSSASVTSTKKNSGSSNNISSPPANTLPTPQWPENITTNADAKRISEEASRKSLHNWVRASIPKVGPQWNSTVGFPVPIKDHDHVDYSWPPLPDSIWSKEKLEETIEREQFLSYEPARRVYGSASVEAFFRYFDGTQDNQNFSLFSPSQPSTSSHVDG